MLEQFTVGITLRMMGVRYAERDGYFEVLKQSLARCGRRIHDLTNRVGGMADM